jgi:hypothetical protein
VSNVFFERWRGEAQGARFIFDCGQFRTVWVLVQWENVRRRENRSLRDSSCAAVQRSPRHHYVPKLYADCSKEIAMSDGLIKRRADAHFSKLPGVDGGKTIMTESEAVAAAVAAKSVRLKELRLARDAAEQAAPAIPAKKAGKKSSKKNGKEKRPAVSLSDWLKNRQAAGHSH